MKKVLLAIMFLIPALVHADTFSWNHPTTRVDGSPVDPSTDIKLYKFYRGTGLVAANLSKPSANEPPPTTINWSPPVGTTQYWVTAVDQAGTEGPASEKITVVITPTPTPSPTATNTPLPAIGAPQGFTRN